MFFADEQTAIAAGYRPCAVYLPEKYKTWKANQAGQTA
jgi:methylphosphotriester-DNA--protein-cysteine methyltransferase